MPRAAKRDFVTTDAGTIDVLVRFKLNGEPMDLTGWSVSGNAGGFQLSNTPNAHGSGIGVVSASDAEYEFYIANSDLALLDLPLPYSLVLTNPGGDPQPYLTGYLVSDT